MGLTGLTLGFGSGVDTGRDSDNYSKGCVKPYINKVLLETINSKLFLHVLQVLVRLEALEVLVLALELDQELESVMAPVVAALFQEVLGMALVLQVLV